MVHSKFFKYIKTTLTLKISKKVYTMFFKHFHYFKGERYSKNVKKCYTAGCENVFYVICIYIL